MPDFSSYLIRMCEYCFVFSIYLVSDYLIDISEDLLMVPVHMKKECSMVVLIISVQDEISLLILYSFPEALNHISVAAFLKFLTVMKRLFAYSSKRDLKRFSMNSFLVLYISEMTSFLIFLTFSR